MRFPPIIRRVQFGSFLGGQTKNTKRAYVGLFLMSFLFMKKRVFVTLMRLPTPWKRRPNSLSLESSQSSFLLVFESSYLYYMARLLVRCREKCKVWDSWDLIWALKLGVRASVATAESEKAD